MSYPAGVILFDIDGTLLRTGDRAHSGAFVHAFEQVYGKPVTLEGVSLAGMLDANIARVLFEIHDLDREAADSRLAEMMAAMGARYEEVTAGVDARERLLPGVVEAIVACQARGWQTGVLTGNAEAVGWAKLRAAGLEQLLPFGAFGDVARERGHLVELALDAAERRTGVRHTPDQAVLIGDTPEDIAAARLGGAHVLAVATGRFSVDALREHAPDAVFENLADTSGVVAALAATLASRLRHVEG
ncbi:MAG: haloacid dehalogenase [Chloroflexi bacterium]|nr:MAG: haloacid dehalogenase [Chloroflexota bacterium]